VAGRHEERDIAEAVSIQTPRERQHHLARGREGEACGERNARRPGAAREKREAHEPCAGARGGLAVLHPIPVEREAEDDRGDDREVHRRILACGTG